MFSFYIIFALFLIEIDALNIQNMCFIFKTQEEVRNKNIVNSVLKSRDITVDSKYTLLYDGTIKDLTVKINETKKLGCEVVFGRSGIVEDLLNLGNLNSLLKFHGMYFFDAVLQSVPTCYSRLIRGYLSCYTIYYYYVGYLRISKDVALVYEDSSELVDCVGLYSIYFEHEGYNSSLLFNVKTQKDYERLLVFQSKPGYLINLLMPAETEKLTTFIHDKNLELTTISFHSINLHDLTIFPTSRNPKEIYYVASEFFVNISSDTSFITEFIVTDPDDDFTTGEIMLYQLLALYCDLMISDEITDSSTLVFNAYNRETNLLGKSIMISSQNALVSSIEGYKVIVNANVNEFSNDPLHITSFFNRIEVKTVFEEPYAEICDFTKAETSITSPYQFLFLITYLTGPNSRLIGGLKWVLEATVKDINKNNPLFGIPLYSSQLDLNAGVDNVIQTLNFFLDRIDIIGIVYYGGAELLKEIEPKMNNQHVTILSFGLTGDSGCSSRTIFTGLNIQSLWESILEFSMASKVFLVYNSGYESLKEYEYVVASCAENNILLVDNAYLESLTAGNAQNACLKIKAKCLREDNCTVVNLLDRDYYVIFFEYIKLLGMNSTTFDIISLSLDDDMVSVIGPTILSGFPVIGYYFNSMNSEEGQHLKKIMMENYYYSPISNIMTLVYSNINLFVESLRSNKISNIESVIYGLIHSTFEGPGGHIYVGPWGYTSQLLHSGTIMDNGDIKIDKTVSGTMKVRAFHDPAFSCDWMTGKTKISPVKEFVFLYVEDHFGDSRLTYFRRYAKTIVDHINSDDGIAGYMIRLVIPQFKTVLEMINYTSKYDYSNVLAYFGTTSSDERTQLSPILEKQNKLLFSIHSGVGEECYKNIIQIGKLPHHYVMQLFGYFIQRSENCFVLTDSLHSNHEMADYLIMVSELFNTFKCSQIDISIIPNQEILANISLLQSAIIFTLITNRTEEFLSDLSKQQLPPQDFPVVILDLFYPLYFNSKNKTLYHGHYYVSSYSLHSNAQENIKYQFLYKNFYGIVENYLNEDSVNLLTVTLLIKFVMGDSYIHDSNVMRLKLYSGVNVQTPMGDIKINVNNVMNSYYTLSHFLEETDEIMITLSHPINRSPFSAFLNNGINLECDFGQGIFQNIYVKRTLQYSLWTDSNNELLYFFLREYQEIVNTDGGFLGLNYDVQKISCDNETALIESIERDDHVIISVCSEAINSKLFPLFITSKSVLFTLNDRSFSACNNSIISIGLSPYQRIVPMVTYFAGEYTAVALIIMPTKYNNSVTRTLLIEKLLQDGFVIPENVLLDESQDMFTIQQTISGLIAKVIRYMPNGGLIFNFLEKYSSFVYEELYFTLQDRFDDTTSSLSMSKLFGIFCPDITTFLNVPIKYRAGHFVLGSADLLSSDYVLSLWKSLFGKDKMPSTVDSRGALAFEILFNTLSLTGSDDYDVFHNYYRQNHIQTTYGDVAIDVDNYVVIPIKLLTSDITGEMLPVTVLANYFPSQAFKGSKYLTDQQLVCNFSSNPETGFSIFPIINIVILLPISGPMNYIGVELLYSYVSAIDFINQHGGIQGRYLGAVIIDIVPEGVLVDTLNKMKSKYHTRIALGVYDGTTRFSVGELLNDQELLLFYPHDYEGFECFENIIYSGMPYSVRVAYVPWILHTFGKSIIILFTSNAAQRSIYEFMKTELTLRGVTIIRAFDVQFSGYDMKRTVTMIKTEMDSGVVISLLEGKARIDLFKTMYEMSLKPPDYFIVADKILPNDYAGESGKYFLNHYIWRSYPLEIYPFSEHRQQMTNEFTFIGQSTGNANAFISIAIFYKAFSELKFNESEAIPYTFRELLSAVHHTVVTEANRTIRVFTNNHISYSVATAQIIFDPNTNRYAANTFYEFHSDLVGPNPWRTGDYLSGKYTCNWDVSLIAIKRGSKLLADTYMVGIVFQFNDKNSLDLNGLNMVIALLQEVNDKTGGLLNKTLTFRVWNTEAIDKTIYEIAEEVASNENIDTVFGCYTDECRIVLSAALMKNNKYLFYASVFAGEECNPNIIYTGALPNQLVEPLSSYLPRLSDSKKTIFIGQTDLDPKFSEIYRDVILATIDPSIEIVDVIMIDSQDVISSQASSIIQQLSTGGIVLTTLGGFSLYKFLNVLQKESSVRGLLSVVCYGADRDLTVFDNNGMINIYVPNYYFDEVNPSNDFFQTAYEYTAYSHYSAFENSIYIAVNVWKNAVLQVQSFKPEKWINSIGGSNVMSGFGRIPISNSRMAFLPFYLGQYLPNSDRFDVIFSYTVLIDPMPWNWNIPGNYGKMCIHGNGNSNDTTETMTIIVGVSTTGLMKQVDSGLISVLKLFVDESNFGGGIIQQRLHAQIINIESDDTVCHEQILKSILSAESVALIITTGGTPCLNVILPEAISRDIPIIHAGIAGGEFCNNNILFVNKEPSILEKVVHILNDVRDLKTLSYSIILSNDEGSISASEYLQSLVKGLGGEIVLVSTVLGIPQQDYINSFLSTVKTRSPTGCFIAIFGISQLYSLIDVALGINDMDPTIFQIVTYSTGDELTTSSINPFYSIKSYFESINTPINKEFIRLVKRYNNEPITENMVGLYAMLNIWKDAITLSKSVNFTVYQSALYSITFDSPEGLLSLQPNNYLRHFLRISYKESASTHLKMIYESSTAFDPHVWKSGMNNGYFVCDFSDVNAGEKSKQPTTTIGVLTSFSGIYSLAERLILNGIKAAVGEINDHGGILGHKIIMETKDAKSHDKEYVNCAKEFGKLKNIKAVFGGSRYAIQQPVSQIAVQYSYLFFYPGISGAEFCSENTITFGYTSNQIMSALKKYTSHLFTSYILVHDDTSFAKKLCEATEMFIRETKKLLYGTFSMFQIQDLYNFPSEIFSKTVIFCPVTIDNVVQFITDMCMHNINGLNANIFLPSLDQLTVSLIPEKCRSGLNFLATFSDDMDTIQSNGVTKSEAGLAFHTYILDNFGSNTLLTQQLESGYTSVTVWAEAVKIANSFEPEKLRKALYGLTTTTPAGKITVNNNGYVSHRVYALVVSKDGSTPIVDYSAEPESALAYNQLLPESQGYQCDFTGKGSKFKADYIKIAIFHDSSPKYHDREMRLFNFEEYLIDDLNENGVNGYLLQPIMIFAQTEEEYYQEIKKIENDTDIQLYIGCRGDPCRLVVKSESERLNILFVYTGISPGFFCGPNILISGNTGYQKGKGVAMYMERMGAEQYLILLDTTQNMEVYMLVMNSLLSKEYNYIKPSYIIINETNRSESYYRDIVKQVLKFKQSYHLIALLSFVDGEPARILVKVMADMRFNVRENLFVLMRYTVSDFSDGILSILPGVLVCLSYSWKVTSSLSQSFCNDIKNNNGNKASCLQEMEFFKVGLDLWKTAMRQASIDSGKRIPSIDYLRQTLIGLSIQTPSGSVTVEESLNIKRSIYILETNSEADFFQVFPSGKQTIVIEAKPYPDGLPDNCKYGKTKEFYQSTTGITALFYTLIGVGIVFCIWTICFTVKFRNANIIRSFGRSYSYCLSFQLLFSTMSLCVFIIQPTESGMICEARVIAIGLCFKGLLSILFSKVTKVLTVFTRSRRLIVKTRITFFRVFCFWLSGVSFEAVLLLIWMLVDPPTFNAIHSDSESSYFVDVFVRVCTTSTTFLIIEFITDGLLLLLLVYMCFKSRNSANEHNDSTGMYISSIVLTFLSVVIVSLDFSMYSSPDVLIIFRVLGGTMIIILLVLLQFGIKLVNTFLSDSAVATTESGSKNQRDPTTKLTTDIHSSSFSRTDNSSRIVSSAFLSSKMTHTVRTLNPI